MRILAIETSTKNSSIAVLEDHRVIRETGLPSDQGTARALAPALEAMFRETGWSPGSVDFVAVTHGPGSFTGLRIAVTTAKMFAYATGAQLVAVNTLRTLVEQLPAGVTDACAVINAQRQQVFAARYQRHAGQAWQVSLPCQVLGRDALLDILSPHTVVTGPLLARWSPPLRENQIQAPPGCWTPRAGTVAQLGRRLALAGHRDDIFELRPQYYRRSYAEETGR